MPIYEYTCPKCGFAFEELIRSAAGRDKVKCPKCAAKAKRQFSVFSAAVAPSPGGHVPGPACDGCPSGGACPYQS